MSSARGQPACGRDERPALVDPEGATARSDQRRDVAQHHAGAAADLEDVLTGADRDEAQEALAQASLTGRAAAGLQRGDELVGVGLGIDVPIRIGMRARARVGRHYVSAA